MVVVLVNLIAMSGNMSSGKTKSRIPLRLRSYFPSVYPGQLAWGHILLWFPSATKKLTLPLLCSLMGHHAGTKGTMRSRQSGHRSPKRVGSGGQGRAWLMGSWLTLPSILLVSVTVLPFHYLHSSVPSFLHSKSGCLLPVRHCARCSAGS